MSQYKLTYFDFDGGRGEPVRIALHAAGIEFEDVRWTFPEFGQHRESLRFNAVPSLEIDGQAFTQSNAMSRYVGKLGNLYPEDPMQALYCDEVLEALEDVNNYVVQTFGLQGEELKTARQQLLDGRLTVFTKGLSELLKRGGGQYFAGNQLTVADLKMYCLLKQLLSGSLDHIPAEFVSQQSPELLEYYKQIEQEAVVVVYYKSLGR